jgi:hypothetical protein
MESGSAELEWPAGAIWQGRGVIRIRSLGALLWVTVEGDPEDYFLGPGNVMRLDAGRRKVVVQALRPGRVRMAVGAGVIAEPGEVSAWVSEKEAGSAWRALLSRSRACFALAQAAFAGLSSLSPPPVPGQSDESEDD